MATPKKARSLTRRRTRRNAAEKAKKLPVTVICKNCLNHRISHHMCGYCGFYKNKLILAPKVRKIKENEEETSN